MELKSYDGTWRQALRMNEVTQIINRIEQGDPQATQQLLPKVYEELRRLASQRMNHERIEHTLTPTALVHEAYVRLVDSQQAANWKGRGHFFAAAAEAMRRILIDHARKKKAAKRGGDAQKFELVESWLAGPSARSELLDLDRALDQLEQADAEAATLVKLRFFAGMTNRQAAENMDLSPRKADMLWAYARSWLKREMSED